MYGEVERCNWDWNCVKQWDQDTADWETLPEEEKNRRLAQKEFEDRERAERERIEREREEREQLEREQREQREKEDRAPFAIEDETPYGGNDGSGHESRLPRAQPPMMALGYCKPTRPSLPSPPGHSLHRRKQDTHSTSQPGNPYSPFEAKTPRRIGPPR
ncbi:hypothetical protein KC368_g6721 [Hortaea werneckii]|nr:hypothetical protein KC368_g6721 [Hortaea werneckii]